ncbi:hypothetical protein HPB48_000766 [Haemaphysalis longicornis]|uniref:Uncharacterized protein n=1 Tax=Haemaphysalis longicornis TaxID=44386 RepID=A0A9J6GSU4_HAELO|nr:hypothetical protein HPB48_000766 [Haemaphysalis longicornis]
MRKASAWRRKWTPSNGTERPAETLVGPHANLGWITDAARKALVSKDTVVVFVSDGCTLIAQPAGVSWKKPFKDSLRETLESYIRAGTVTPKGNLNKPCREDVVNFVAKARAAVTEDISPAP